MNRKTLFVALGIVMILTSAYILRRADNPFRKPSYANTSSANTDLPTSNLSSSQTPSRVEQIYDQRISVLRQECLLNRGGYNEGWVSLRKWVDKPVKDRPRIFVSDKYKIAVCMVPKCGTTQWRKLLVKLDNNYKEFSDAEFKRGWNKRLLWSLHDISTRRGLETAERKLNEYYRIIPVREPLERLVSAYRDKLELLQDSHFGPISQELHMKYGNGSAGTATFSEFVDSILEENTPENLNRHWRPFTVNCDPCLLNFDIIAKLETIKSDFPFIAKKLRIRRNSAFTDESDSLSDKWRTNYHDYLKSLSEEQRLKIFRYYKSQYDYFGYPYPNYI